MRSRVTLTTDFGTRDPYVAQLKAELYARGPTELDVVDLSHEIAPQNVREAALFVRAAWPRFPAGTIHLVVVDPGVGSSRRALAVAHGEQLLLGPDNGVLTLLLAAGGGGQTVAIDPLRLGLTQISATFHGRDVFAPAAARLACGAKLHELGPDALHLVQLALPAPRLEAKRLCGEIIHVDRFGNLISNLPSAALHDPRLGHAPQLHLNDGTRLQLVHTYAQAPEATAVALVGSSDLIEIAVRDANASALLRLGVGAAVWLSGG